MKPIPNRTIPFFSSPCPWGTKPVPKPKHGQTRNRAKENPDFSIQGEYAAEGAGLQVVALGKGQFQAALYEGGLPGVGAKSTQFDLFKGTLADGVLKLEGKGGKTITVEGGKATGEGRTLLKILRKSPTLGQKAPDGAVYLFNSETGRMASPQVPPGGNI